MSLSQAEFLETQLQRVRDLPNENQQCPICSDHFCDAVCLPCDQAHIFCRDCILYWFSKGNHTCPLCHNVLFEREKLQVEEPRAVEEHIEEIQIEEEVQMEEGQIEEAHAEEVQAEEVQVEEVQAAVPWAEVGAELRSELLFELSVTVPLLLISREPMHGWRELDLGYDLTPQVDLTRHDNQVILAAGPLTQRGVDTNGEAQMHIVQNEFETLAVTGIICIGNNSTAVQSISADDDGVNDANLAGRQNSAAQ